METSSLNETKTCFYAVVSSATKEETLRLFLDMGADENNVVFDMENEGYVEKNGYMSLKEERLEPGNTLVVPSLDCLGTDKDGLLRELLFLKRRHIRLKVLDMPSTTKEYGPGLDEMAIDILIAGIGR